MDKEIDCSYTWTMVCPYCGNEETNPEEWIEDSGEAYCSDCGEKFHYERNVSVDYTTTKIINREQE